MRAQAPVACGHRVRSCLLPISADPCFAQRQFAGTGASSSGLQTVTWITECHRRSLTAPGTGQRVRPTKLFVRPANIFAAPRERQLSADHTGIAGFQPARHRRGSMPRRRRRDDPNRPKTTQPPPIARRGHRAPGARSRLESRRSQSTPERRVSAGPLLRDIGGDSGWGCRRTMTRQRFASGSALGSSRTPGPGRPAHPSSRPAPRIRPRVLWTPICRPPTPPPLLAAANAMGLMLGSRLIRVIHPQRGSQA